MITVRFQSWLIRFYYITFLSQFQSKDHNVIFLSYFPFTGRGPDFLDKENTFCLSDKRCFLVPLTGLEPVRRFRQGILSPWCLPIPPQRRNKLWNAVITILDLNGFVKGKRRFYVFSTRISVFFLHSTVRFYGYYCASFPHSAANSS